MSTADHKSRLSPLSLAWAGLAVGGALLWLNFVVGEESVRAWRAMLISFLFFTPLAGGMAVWPAIIRSCNGSWHTGVERLAAAGIGFAVPSVLILIVLWIGSHRWAPWYTTNFHQGIWLNNSFVFGRDVAALTFFWVMAARYAMERRKGEARVEGGILVTAYALVFSLLGMDLVMALDPKWYSTLAGGYFFISGLYISVSAWAFRSALDAEAHESHRHDLGKLMVGFSLMTTYLMYAHLLPIWYEALPAEVRFIVPRMNFQPWKTVSLLLLAVVYFGPLVLLLLERAKRSRWTLGAVALLVLAGMWVERWWLVAPTFQQTAELGLIELSTVAAFGGLLALGLAWARPCVAQRETGTDGRGTP